jgi:soluble lytic murein transglycosylase-like protein
MKVPAGMSQVLGRIQQIESRIAQISGGDAPSEQSLGIPNTEVPFDQVLQRTQRGAPALPAGYPMPLQPISPDGSPIRPIDMPTVTNFAPIIQSSAEKYGVDPNLVSAVIQTESSGNPKAVSHAGAMGLMQLMPSNVNEYGVRDPFDPVQNIDAGTRQLSDLLKQYNGDVDLALAAYNAGPGAVSKYGGIPPYAETQNYVRKIRGLMGSR